MRYYRLYHLDKGHIRRFEVLYAPDDNAALLQIEAMDRDGAVELWCRERKVVVLPEPNAEPLDLTVRH